jgi:hypothetical protein
LPEDVVLRGNEAATPVLKGFFGNGQAAEGGGPIGPNEALIFEIELLEIVDGN